MRNDTIGNRFSEIVKYVSNPIVKLLDIQAVKPENSRNALIAYQTTECTFELYVYGMN
jgi:hypothetical protein